MSGLELLSRYAADAGFSVVRRGDSLVVRLRRFATIRASLVERDLVLEPRFGVVARRTAMVGSIVLWAAAAPMTVLVVALDVWGAWTPLFVLNMAAALAAGIWWDVARYRESNRMMQQLRDVWESDTLPE